jgi:hypothetical protein
MSGLLAVDLGLRTGLARFGPDGRLAWYRSQHFGTRDALRRGVHGLLAADPDLSHLVLEGGGPIADIWIKAAERRGLVTLAIAAECWRARLLDPKGLADRDRAKRDADALARRVIAWSGAARPTSLRHDAAEAVLVGLWGVLELGWLASLPPELAP